MLVSQATGHTSKGLDIDAHSQGMAAAKHDKTRSRGL